MNKTISTRHHWSLTTLALVTGVMLAVLAPAAPAHAAAPAGESHRSCTTIERHVSWRVDACVGLNHNGSGGVQLLATIAMRNASDQLVTADSLTVRGMNLENGSDVSVSSRGTASQGGVGRMVVGSITNFGSGVFYQCGHILVEGGSTWATFDARFPDGTTIDGFTKLHPAASHSTYPIEC